MSLLSRIMLVSVLVFCFAASLLFLELFHHESHLLETVLHSELSEELRALSSTITDDLVVGDYATLERGLKDHVNNKYVSQITFTFVTGKSISFSDQNIASQSPAWFNAVLKDPGIQGVQIITLGGKVYGELKVQMTAQELIDDAWRQFLYVIKIVMASLVFYVLMTYLTLNRGLRPLKELFAVKHKFAGGDLSIRAVEAGSPEFRELAREFNSMAQQIEKQNTSLKSSEQQFEAILKAVPDLMFKIDKSGCYLNVWGKRGDLLARPINELVGRTVSEILPSSASLEVLAAIQDADTKDYSFGRQIQLEVPQGICCFELSVAKLGTTNGSESEFIVLSRDITERKQMEEQVNQLAFYDTLTNLPNRRLLNDRLIRAMAASNRSTQYCALMFIDLDNFKPLNDTHGHAVGDLLLIDTANRLKSCVREIDTVARFGGDEFVVILSELNIDKDQSTSQAFIVAEKILAALSLPYELTVTPDGKPSTTIEHHCTASIGVTVFINHEVSLDQILKQADKAMYQAKDSGRNLIRIFEAES